MRSDDRGKLSLVLIGIPISSRRLLKRKSFDSLFKGENGLERNCSWEASYLY